MRILSLFLLLAGVLSSAAAATEIEIVRVWPQYRHAGSFKRISEYFTGRENTRGHIIHRTQMDERGGYYFLTRLRNKGAALEYARIELRVVTPDAPADKTYLFDTYIPTGKPVYLVGLTGVDWTDPKKQPVAWQIRFLDAAGAEIAREKSFLWSLH